jgi:hypothetical protein
VGPNDVKLPTEESIDSFVGWASRKVVFAVEVVTGELELLLAVFWSPPMSVTAMGAALHVVLPTMTVADDTPLSPMNNSLVLGKQSNVSIVNTVPLNWARPTWDSKLPLSSQVIIFMLDGCMM